MRSTVVMAALFSLEEVRRSGGQLMAIELGADRLPAGARVAGIVGAPQERVADVIADVAGYAGRVPMLSRVHLEGDRARVQLRFGLSIFSVRFEFVAAVVHDASLRW